MQGAELIQTMLPYKELECIYLPTPDFPTATLRWLLLYLTPHC